MGGEETDFIHDLHRPCIPARDLCATVNEVEAVNATLPPAQRVAKFLLLYKELDADDGELTRTRKVRRSVINEKYAGIIDGIYGGKPDIAVDTVIRFQDGTTQRIRTTLAVVDMGLAHDAPPVADAAE